MFSLISSSKNIKLNAVRCFNTRVALSQERRCVQKIRTRCNEKHHSGHSESEKTSFSGAKQEQGEDEQGLRPISNDDVAFGPRGILLAGFTEQDSREVREWMQEMEPDFKVSHVTDDMMTDALGAALYNRETQEMRVEPWNQTRTLCPRICILSGMTGEEQIAIAEVWDEFAGSPAPFFAAAVPRSLERPVKELLQGIVDENAQVQENDPRLDPGNFVPNANMARLREQIADKLKKEAVKREKKAAKKKKLASEEKKGFGS